MPFKADEHMMQFKGSDYLPTVWRVVWFREDHPDGQIDTEVVFWDHERHEIMVRATVVAPKTGARAVAHCVCSLAEFKNGYCEKAETQAVGRALALLGYGTAFAGQDLEEGERPADAPAVVPVSSSGNGARGSVGRTGTSGSADGASFAARAGAALKPLDGPLEANGQAMLAELRAEVIALLERDGAALDLLKAKGTLPADMNGDQLRKAKDWLLERERRNVPVSVRLGRSIDAAATPEALRIAQQAVQQARDQKGISQAEYVGLLQAFERRRTELSGPLTAQVGMRPGTTAAGAPS